MNFTYRLHPLADKDMTEAYVWYEDMLAGLGERFIETVKKKIASIITHPELYGSKKKGYRETTLSNDFPYLIVYKINYTKKEILISAIFHGKRDPHKKYRS